MVTEQKLYTVTEFEAFVALPEHDDHLYELINGEIVEKVVTQEHGIVVATLVTEIGIYLKTHPIGRISVETSHRLPNDIHNERLPDISLVSDKSKPVVREGSVYAMPDLAVEVKSPGNTIKAIREKAQYYLANGARMVWLVYPDKRLVEVYTPDDIQILRDDEILDGGDVLPDFKLAVRDIFAD